MMNFRILNYFVAFFVLTSLKIIVTQQVSETTKWNVQFTPNNLTISMGTSELVQLEIKDDNSSSSTLYRYQLQSENPELATVDYTINPSSIQPYSWIGNITVNGILIGETALYVERINLVDNSTEKNTNQNLDIVILRRKGLIDNLFVVSVALLVSLLYINFGAALDLQVLGGLVRRPIGPIIGFGLQFLFMPLLSYALGLLLFPDSIAMQLGLFFTGVSPSGGASNIWTVVLGGNTNLSILMTTIGNFAAFGTMPLWIFTLGRLIFERGNMEVPYMKIATFAISLVVPLAIGLLIQRFSMRATRWLVRLLKPISVCLLLFIIIFAIVANLYIFKLFSWQIILAGLALPWLGYVVAWIIAKVLRQNSADSLTIAIETGIQNTGISIFLLTLCLPQPQADLTTVIPVAVAIMTPFPLLGLYIYRRCTGRNIKDGENDATHIVGTQQDDNLNSSYHSNNS